MVEFEREIGLPILKLRRKVQFANTYLALPDPQRLAAADIWNCYNLPGCPPHIFAWPFSTPLVDLDRDEDLVFGCIDRDARAKIRRAAKDGLQFRVEQQHSLESIDRFCAFYQKFSMTKGVGSVHPTEVHGLARSGRLMLARACDANGEPLVWHAYFETPARAIQLYSVSQHLSATDSAARQLLGRANRWLHWEEMRYFKAKGVRWFDLGGWYAGRTNQHLLRINAFKAEFGGEVIQEWNALIGGTSFGRILVKARRLRDWARRG